MIKINQTWDNINNIKLGAFDAYPVKCDSEKYATHISKDSVYFCFYGTDIEKSVSIIDAIK